MTMDQYNRALEISEEINQMTLVTDEICSDNYNYRIAFIHKQKDSIKANNWQICDCMHTIKDILDKHEAMIRQEINDRINILYNEIEEL